MDGLSAAASVIALVQITSKLIGICWSYKGLKNASGNAKRLINQLEGLKLLLEKIDELLEDESLHSLRHKTLEEWTSSGRLKDFHSSLEHLVRELQPSQGVRALRNAIMFPLQQQDLERALEEIERMKSTLDLALSLDQTKQMGAIEAGVAKVRLGQETEENRRQLEAIQKWLAAPDVTTNQALKQEERQGESGRWLLHLDVFTKWLLQNNSIFWIHGIPGSGKSVLCSTVVHQALEDPAEKIEKTAIYFYFDTREESKRSTENMIRALISQLAHRKMDNPLLNETYQACQDRRRVVTQEQLLSILTDMLAGLLDVVVIIDAIDEALDIHAVLHTIRQIHACKLDNVHILLTSRWTGAIEDCMANVRADVVELSGHNVERDISAYVHDTVNQSQRWPEPDRSKLSQAIVLRAQGLFRLASCLIDLVAECRTSRALNELLESLPPDLNTVYERILLRIPRNERGSTKRMLEWLAFSGRPLRIGELTHATAVNHPNLQGFSPLDLDIAPFDAPLLCSSLVIKAQANILDVQSAPAYYSSAIDFATELEFEEVRLAHASVKEFLLGGALKDSAASDFYLDAQLAHRNIAETCLLYLLAPEMRFGVASQIRHQQLLKDWPLLLYAAHFWPDHANAAKSHFREETWQLIARLFETRNSALAGNYGTWAQTLTPEISLSDVQVTTPLYYASSFGLTKVIARLLDGGARAHINQLGGGHQSTALEVAAYRGRLEAVKMLLSAGADPNATLKGAYASTLSWPILRNHGAVAVYLIEHGATVLPGEWDDLRRFGWSDLAEYCLRLWERRMTFEHISGASAVGQQAVGGA